MIQNLILTVESDKPLEKYGEGYMLVYDSNIKGFQVKSEEMFFEPYEKRMKELEEEIKKIREEMKEFTGQMTENYDNFIGEYQQTNEKIINMVEELMEEN